jgi:hypothetical protein
MNIFKKKSLCAALAGIGALGVAGAAQAVNLDPDGLGEVLIYPYYTTRSDTAGNAYNSLLSVVNTTASVKAVKVRFLEGRNSREVLDFNLYLSPKDVWTAGIGPNTATGGANITSRDKSCTLPLAVSQGTTIEFRNSAYASDGAGATLDRTREGYVEIIEMATYADNSTTAGNVTHVAGVPPGCAKQTDALGSAEARPPTGGLMGGMTLINVNSGTDYTEDAVALDNFSAIPLYTGAGVDTPNLQNANNFAAPPTSVVVANGTVYTTTWAAGTADPVSAVLMHDHIMNEFVLDSGTHSGTDWVVTMPTKRFYVANGTGAASRLFQRNFNNLAGSCDDVSLNIYDREENTTSTPLDFSPQPTAGVNQLCWEANVVTFNATTTSPQVVSNVLGSLNATSVPTTFQNGWLDLSFQPTTVTPPVHTLVSGATATTRTVIGGATTTGPGTYVGLPAVGFAVQSFLNGAIIVNGNGIQSNYGGNFVQKGTRLVQ